MKAWSLKRQTLRVYSATVLKPVEAIDRGGLCTQEMQLKIKASCAIKVGIAM